MTVFAVLLLQGFAVCARAQQSAPVISIQELGKGIVSLDGPWQFHLGDNRAWALPQAADATGHDGWQQISADSPWGDQGHRSYTGYAWYRLHLRLTPAEGSSGNFALLFERVEDVYDVYWNGQLIAHHGKFPPDPSWSLTVAPETFGMGKARDGVLAVRVWKAPLFSFDSGLQGGFDAVPVIGSPTAIGNLRAALDYDWLRTRQYSFGLDTLYALIVVLSLLTWWRNRSQPLMLWLALYCLSNLAILFLRHLGLPWSAQFSLGMSQPVYSVSDFSLWFLLMYLLKLNEDRRISTLTRILAVISFVSFSLDGLLVVADWSNPAHTRLLQIGDGVLTSVYINLEMYPLLLVALALRKRLDLTRWLVAVFAFLSEMVAVITNFVNEGSRFTHWSLFIKLNQPLFTIYGNTFTAQRLADTGLLMAIIYAVYRYSRETIERQQAIEQELKSAQELQQVLIPEALPSLPGYGVTSSYRPAQEVGGDFFQIIPVEDGSTLVVLGDVSGKGLRAAMAVSLIVGAVRTLAEVNPSPAAILAGLNRRLYNRLQGGFATCLVLHLDAEGRCVIAAAGHPAPYLNGREVELAGALPLGLVAAISMEEVTVQLAVNDFLVLYTDGLLESRSATGEIFGFERLSRLAANRPSAAAAMEAALRYGQEDDITVLTITRLAAGEESTTELLTPDFASA